ncbi:MAG: hypothetical protein HQK77_20405 [Desulfobacterales bacterium]|nr:hypothetical protein [Desulfobacterales bacterium]
MFHFSKEEQSIIDEVLEPKWKWATEKITETEQMALDATRMLACNEPITGLSERRIFQANLVWVM